VTDRNPDIDDDFDLREIASVTWENFQSLINRAILNNISWVENKKPELDLAEIASGVMKDADGAICGYDFLLDKPIEIPCMTSSAAFPMRYAHVLPALMISNFMKRTQSENVDMTVLCHGYGFQELEKWWTEDDKAATPDDAARFIVESEAFKSYVDTPRTKPIKRICIWMLCIGHAFMVVWEQGERHDVIYFADNAVGVEEIDLFRNEFLKKFKERLSPHRSMGILKRELFKTSIFSTAEIEIHSDLVCVSFMARSTVYLNTMDSFLDKDVVRFIVDLTDARFQALCYLKFEKALAKFLTACLINNGLCHAGKKCNSRCVWLPEVMKNKFVNINDICLLVFNPNKKKGLEMANHCEFFFGECSSFKAVNHSSGNTSIDIGSGPCTIASDYDTALLMRGCRNALDDALGLLSK
jgi:hypothetical protein